MIPVANVEFQGDAIQPAHSGAMKPPQARQDQRQAMRGTTEHRMHPVAQRALEPVSLQQPVCLYVPDHRLDRVAQLEQILQRCG